MSSPCDLIGIGSPLVDLLLEVDDAFLAAHVPGAKGGMELVEAAQITQLVAAADREPLCVAGGAASNTTVGVANLGLTTAFIGCCGQDDEAGFYRSALERQGCEARLIEHPFLPTGRVLSLITPDAERTMRTCLGAAAALEPAQVSPALFAGGALVMLEGYTLFNHDLTRAIVTAAKQAGAEIALDLASFEVVHANRAVLDELLDGQIDLVFANEDEARAWHPDGESAALEDLAARARIAVVKLGKDGALIARGDERHRIPAEVVDAVDTTGAGDSWAAGFLAAYRRGLSLPLCGAIGAQAGAAAVSVLGAQVPRAAWQGIRGYLDAQLA